MYSLAKWDEKQWLGREKRDDIVSRGLDSVYVHISSMIFGMQSEPNNT